ncbi:Hexosaminidase D-like 3 [Homarus americanus]|uniref:beta-N-acetylhexosaminidase n=2 Tax=Homarus americanus TaxID=6706 RepID=A0A8J5KHQ8_HOMAM|nr:Hexosaminidase D-like 3 [Homarus americanus]
MTAKCRRRRLGLVMGALTVAGVVAVLWLVSNASPILKNPIFLVTPRQSHLPRVYHTPGVELHTEVGTEMPSDRLWHLDLKGGAPRIKVIEGIMMLAARAGATGVLLEWEDMFPFSGALANLSARNAYTHEEVKHIATAAKTAGLTMVHLMQSLGHLEYALKLPQWVMLREGESPAEACPSHPGTARLVIEAVNQLMEAVPTSIIHIGADEVFTLAQCKRCQAREQAPLRLYVDHVAHVAQHVKSRWGVRVLVWDDMLRHAPSYLLHSLAGLVEPTVWAYGPDVSRMVPPYILRTYSAVFPRVWLAPAFKGATGPLAIMPDAARHAANTLAWVQVGQRMKHYANLNVAGIVITGWSRYDHFAVLCELLPPSTPSLVVTLLTASRGFMTPATLHDAHTLLDCPPHVMLDPARDPHLWAARDCAFPGANMVSFLHRYVRLRDDVKTLQREAEERGGWLTAYNIRHNFSSPNRVREYMTNLRSFISALKDLHGEAEAVLTQYHNTATVEEWTEQHLLPLNLTLSKFTSVSATLLSHKTWPRRPLEGRPSSAT